MNPQEDLQQIVDKFNDDYLVWSLKYNYGAIFGISYGEVGKGITISGVSALNSLDLKELPIIDKYAKILKDVHDGSESGTPIARCACSTGADEKQDCCGSACACSNEHQCCDS